MKDVSSDVYHILRGAEQTVYDNIDDVRDVLGVIGDSVTAVKLLKIVITLPERLYMRKYRRFADGIVKYNLSERRKILQEVSKLKVENQIPFILNVINASEEEEKMDSLVKLTEGWLEERLDDATYRRLALMMERTPYDDLLYLKSLFKKRHIELRSMVDESLLANGWLTADSVALQTIHQDAAIECHLTVNAWKFGEIVFGIQLEDEPQPAAPSLIIDVQEKQKQ